MTNNNAMHEQETGSVVSCGRCDPRLGAAGSRNLPASAIENQRVTGLRLVVLGAALVLAGLSSPGPARAAVFVVDDTSDRIDLAPGDGVCSTTIATCTLRAAIQEANNLGGADDIMVPAGLYTLSIAGPGENAAASGDLDILDDLDILGAGVGKTIIDGAGSDRIFEASLGVVLIADMTIRNGRADLTSSPLGGGIHAAGATLDVVRVELTGNVANAGGGMRVSGGPVDIIDCIFSNNHAADLGFTNAEGGGLSTAQDTDILGTTFTGNRADLGGGAIWGDGSPALSLENSTLVGNLGTALYTDNTNLDLSNVTVTGNSGYGLDYFSAGGVHSLSVKNSILAGNAPDCRIRGTPPTALDFEGERNLDSDGTCPLDGVMGDLPSTDPQLGELRFAGATSPVRVPRVGSPVIDAGNAGTCRSEDQRGASRPLDGDGVGGAVCDIGSVEVLPCLTTPDRVLENQTVTTSEDYAGCFTLTAGPAFVVGTGAEVTFRARDAIILRNGFSVTSDALSFRVLIDPAAGSGIVLP